MQHILKKAENFFWNVTSWQGSSFKVRKMVDQQWGHYGKMFAYKAMSKCFSVKVPLSPSMHKYYSGAIHNTSGLQELSVHSQGLSHRVLRIISLTASKGELVTMVIFMFNICILPKLSPHNIGKAFIHVIWFCKGQSWERKVLSLSGTHK